MELNLQMSPRQREFWQADGRVADEVLFGGAAGGGKSVGQILDALLYAISYPKSRQLILRRTFPDLERSIISQSLQIIPRGLAAYNAGKHRWRFANGSVIEMGHCAADKDVYQYQGAEYDVIRLDELTHFTEDVYVYLLSRLRGSLPYPRQMKASTNPGGVGHYWVKQRFVDIGAPGEIHAVADEDTGIISKRLFLPSLLKDNPFLLAGDADYERRLLLLPEKERRALLYGDWDVMAGQYFEMFRRDIHTFAPDELPGEGTRFVSIDYGQDMFCALFGLLDERGRMWIYKEIYQSGLLATEAAERLRAATEPGEKIAAYFAPPDLWGRNNQTGKSTVERFAEAGIYFARAVNDRVQGWYDLAEWLRVREDEQGAKTANLRIGTNCLNLLRTLPAIQRSEKNPNDCAIDPHELTHAPDALRYMVAGRPWAKKPPDERKRQRNRSFMQFGH